MKIDNEQTYGLSSIDFDKSNGFIIGWSAGNSIKFFNIKKLIMLDWIKKCS